MMRSPTYKAILKQRKTGNGMHWPPRTSSCRCLQTLWRKGPRAQMAPLSWWIAKTRLSDPFVDSYKDEIPFHPNCCFVDHEDLRGP